MPTWTAGRLTEKVCGSPVGVSTPRTTGNGGSGTGSESRRSKSGIRGAAWSSSSLGVGVHPSIVSVPAISPVGGGSVRCAATRRGTVDPAIHMSPTHSAFRQDIQASFPRALPRPEPAQREDRDVVVLGCVADKLVEPLEQALDDALGRFSAAALEVRLEPQGVEL